MAQNLKTIELLCFYLIFFTNFLAFFQFFSFKFSPPGYGSMRIQIHSPLLSKAYDIKYPKLLFHFVIGRLCTSEKANIRYHPGILYEAFLQCCGPEIIYFRLRLHLCPYFVL